MIQLLVFKTLQCQCHTAGLVWTMSPLELFLVVSAMARVDRRDEQSLRMLAKMCHRCAQRFSLDLERKRVAYVARIVAIPVNLMRLH